jgi:hypothetical protein
VNPAVVAEKVDERALLLRISLYGHASHRRCSAAAGGAGNAAQIGHPSTLWVDESAEKARIAIITIRVSVSADQTDTRSELNMVTKGVDRAPEMRSEARRARPVASGFVAGVMPLPAMYELLRANLDYVGAFNAARRILADDRAAGNRTAN